MASRLPIPRLQSQGGGSLGRRASAADMGAQEGQAQEQRGGIFNAVGESALMLTEADQSARVSRAVAKAAVQLDEVQSQLAQDSDFSTHDERFEKARADILKGVSEGQGIMPGRFQGELENRLFPVAARAQADVRNMARRKLVDQSVALLDETGADWSNRAARSPIGSSARDEAFGQMSEAVRSATSRGIITAQDAVGRLRSFEREVSSADRRAAVAADPLGAYRELQDPGSALAQGLSEAERQQALEGARTEYRQQLEEQHTAERFATWQAEQAKQQRSEKAMKDISDSLAKRDLAGTQELLRQHREDLSPAEYRWTLDQLGGGPAAVPKTVPQVYLDLSRRAAEGESIEQDAAEAYRGGTLDQGDYDRVLKSSKDRRFGDVEDFLRQATRPGLFEIDPARALKSAEIERSFREWMSKHSEATGPEALAHGRELLRSQGIKDGSQLRKTTDPGAQTGTVDIVALTQAALAKAASGEWTPDQLDVELQRIDALEKSQEMAGSPK